MALVAKVDKQSCQSAGRCVEAAPEGFGWDGDHLAETLPGAAALADEQLVAIARACPALAIQLYGPGGEEVDF